MHYAGIGSRKCPQWVLDFMTLIARVLDQKGYTLRSGGAEGADTAFATGATKKEIFRPNDATPEAIEIAMDVHPAPQHCKPYVRKLHGRNVQIILGEDLNVPVEFVICWTPGGKTTGGTGLGIALSKRENITVYNLCNKKDFLKVVERFLYNEAIES